MELPCEIWEKIIIKIKDEKNCIKLYKALPKITQKNIRNKYIDHKKSIQLRIMYSIDNCMILLVEHKKFAILMDDNIDNEIKFVRFVHNFGKKDCFVSVDKKGKIIFWDTQTYEYIDCIEIDSEIQNIEFHPSE